MRLVAGPRFALMQVGGCQLVYLVVFTYSFFFEGLTGLSVTALCIVTLFVAMQLTGRLSWERVCDWPAKTGCEGSGEDVS